MATIFGQKLMQAKNDDDLGGVQRSSIKWGKLCAMTTIFWHKEIADANLRMIDDDANYGGKLGHQSVNMVTYVPWLPYLVKRNNDAS